MFYHEQTIDPELAFAIAHRISTILVTSIPVTLYVKGVSSNYILFFIKNIISYPGTTVSHKYAVITRYVNWDNYADFQP